MKRMRPHLLLVAGALLLLLAAPLAAQRVTGQISGTVRDDSGAVLPGVTVSLTGENIAGTRTNVTNASGFYRILNLPPGLPQGRSKTDARTRARGSPRPQTDNYSCFRSLHPVLATGKQNQRVRRRTEAAQICAGGFRFLNAARLAPRRGWVDNPGHAQDRRAPET